MGSQCAKKRNASDLQAFTEIMESIETEQAIHLPEIQSKTSTKYFDFSNQIPTSNDCAFEEVIGMADQSEIIPYQKCKTGKSVDSVLVSLYKAISKENVEKQKIQRKTKRKSKNVTMRELEKEF